MSAVNPRDDRLHAAGCGLLLAFAMIAVYGPALFAGYVWDDDTHYTTNAVLEHGGLLRTWRGEGQPNYWPLTWTSFWLEHRLFGFDAFASHLINIALHTLNASLLLLVLRRLRVPFAMGAVLLFAFHPANVETVAWVTQRKNLLCAAFALVSTLGFLGQLRGGGRSAAALGIVGFLASLLSKGAAIGLPVLFTLIVYARRIAFDRRTAVRLTPYYALALAFGVIEVVFMQGVRAGEAVFELSFVERLELVLRNLSWYLAQAALPLESIFVHPRWHLGEWPIAGVLPAVAFGLTGTWAFAREKRGLLLGLGGFAVMLGPILGWTDPYFFKYSYVADHYLYLALPMATAGIAAGLSRFDRRGPVVAVVLACGLFAGTVFERSGAFRDEETLWRVTLAKNDEAWVAHSVLGGIEQGRGELSRARRHYEAALALAPPAYDAALVHLNLGTVAMLEGAPEEARRHYEQTVGVLPQTTRAWLNLAASHLAEGDLERHDATLLRALEHPVRKAQVHAHLAESFEARGELDRAARHRAQASALAND